MHAHLYGHAATIKRTTSRRITTKHFFWTHTYGADLNDVRFV